METILYAYQLSPGNDDLLWFAANQEECQRAALEQRAEVKVDEEELGPMAIYRFVLRQLTPAEMIRVLNEEIRLIDSAAVDRRLVSVVTD